MNEDFLDFIAALHEARARFLIVGAHAVAVHGSPRATADIDVWVEPTRENAERVWAALHIFGAPAEALGITVDDFVRLESVVQFGLPPRRIDVLTSVSGVERFDDAWRGKVERRIGQLDVPFIGLHELKLNKRASGRHKDLGDLEALGEK